MLESSILARLDSLLADDDATRQARYPGERAGRQPVHTVYVPADRFASDTPAVWGAAAVSAMDEFGPWLGFGELEVAIRAKLAREPIEDLRIDFEDGYGSPGDEIEDAATTTAASALASAVESQSATAFMGIRMKSLEGPSRARGVRTLDLFLSTLLERVPLPTGFRVTLPKVTSVAQVLVMGQLCEALETEYGVDRLPFELQVETPQAVMGADGSALIAPMIHAAGARCAGLHYGTYDYSASVGISAAYQSMEHPAADYAKAVMQVAAAGTGISLSDGSTNILPVGSPEAVHAGWGLHARLVRRSLERGYYQGWDLHAHQLPTRYAATFAFYREGMTAASARLRAYLGKADAGVMDEPATAMALSGYLLRGLDSGAVTTSEVESAAGLDRTDLQKLARRTG